MHHIIMDSFSAQSYDCKMETFNVCIHTTNQQREMIQPISGQVTEQQVHIENQVDHNTSTLQQQQQQHQQQLSEQSDQITQIQSHNQQGLTLTPVRLPAILDGEFFTVIRIEDTNVTVRCLQCQKLLNGNLKSTGNFLSHIKRVHPLMMDKIKCKSNQRKPAIVYIDLSADKCPEIARAKRGYKKCYKMGDCTTGNEESYDQPAEWNELPLIYRRRSDEPESTDLLKTSHNNSFVVEDEYDAIGRNVAAKLRNMRLDQRIIAEKLLNDILFEAQLGNLNRDSNIHV